jgi:hypothetical protein
MSQLRVTRNTLATAGGLAIKDLPLGRAGGNLNLGEEAIEESEGEGLALSKEEDTPGETPGKTTIEERIQ